MKEADSNDSLPQNTENNTNTSSKLPKSISNIINPDDRSSYIDYLIKTPLFTCLICILTVLFYILSFFFPEFILKLTNIPEFTINKFHVWSLITSFMVSLNFQNWIFPFVIWIPEGRTLERELGTLKYIINFCVNSLIIQIMFLIVSFIFSLFIYKLWEVPSCGIMPAVLAEITILSFANPNNLVTFLKIPLDFRAIYYPFILFFVFLLINLFCFKIDALCGLIFGIIFFYYLRPYLVISNDLILKIESCFPLNYIKQLPSKISYKYRLYRSPSI